jgi:glycosyltransferase involved in cell wall biosynthesis
VYWTALGSHPVTIALKYLGQTLRTWRILAREWPDAVFVMSPSPIAVLAVYAFCAVTRKRFVIDAHSGAFRNPLWKRLQGMQFWLCRRASATIVTNDHLAELVRSHGGHTVVVPDVPVKFPTISTTPSRSGFVVACVTSFGFDEPIEAILEAARRLPDVTFYMTGNPADGGRRLVGKPDNLVLTGFLSVSDYGALLKTADVVLALTTLDHTMLRGAYEAIYQGTPVIISNWPLLRSAFDAGAVHVDNTAAGIMEGIRTMQQEHAAARAGAAQLRQRKFDRWAATLAELKAMAGAQA